MNYPDRYRVIEYLHVRRSYLIRTLAAGTMLAAFFMLQALWIPAKAALGQTLLEHSWQQLKAGNPGVKPWPWADTHAIALLEVPRLEIRQVLLAGSSPRNLAWGPVWFTVNNHKLSGDVILSGHRDTHFSFLQNLREGDDLLVSTADSQVSYQIVRTDIVDSRTTSLQPQSDTRRLTLVTCYPFDALEAGGPMRFVVTALPQKS
jgi:sortase A